MKNWLKRKIFRESVGPEVDAPAEKRLRTPAGLRLSKIVDNPERDGPLIRSPSSTNTNDESSIDITPAPDTQACRTTFTAGSVLKVELKIEESGEECAEKRRIYRRRCLVVSITIATIIALLVGLSVGLKKKFSNEKSPSDSQDTVSASNVGSANSKAPKITGSTNATHATSASNTQFPAGFYTITTFLDSVQRECTSVRDTWSCYPYKSYDEDPVKSTITFHWVISPSSEGVYQISAAANSALIVFPNADLKLIDQRQDSERYEFQLVVDKRVSPSTDLTDDASKAVCFYNKTTFVASLYTKMPKSYPGTSNTTSNAITSLEAAWPYAVRVEQYITAGSEVPDCEPKGHISDRVTKGFVGHGSTGSCSCLYRNYFDAG